MGQFIFSISNLVDQETDLPVTVARVRLVISPVFILDVVDWPEYMQYHRQWERTFTATVSNVGNKDVTVDLDYQVTHLVDLPKATNGL